MTVTCSSMAMGAKGQVEGRFQGSDLANLKNKWPSVAVVRLYNQNSLDKVYTRQHLQYCPCLSSSVSLTPLLRSCCVAASRSEPNWAKAATSRYWASSNFMVPATCNVKQSVQDLRLWPFCPKANLKTKRPGLLKNKWRFLPASWL